MSLLLLLLALCSEDREDAAAKFWVAEHTPVLWVQLPQHTLHILQQHTFATDCHKTGGTKGEIEE
jgi:hypothetical protein